MASDKLLRPEDGDTKPDGMADTANWNKLYSKTFYKKTKNDNENDTHIEKKEEETGLLNHADEKSYSF